LDRTGRVHGHIVGQFWLRYMNENNSRLTEAHNDYTLGWIDLVGRQNVHDLNAHFYIYGPHSSG
jgi:hypothetical protein